jgi:hypothetical protein
MAALVWEGKLRMECLLGMTRAFARLIPVPQTPPVCPHPVKTEGMERAGAPSPRVMLHNRSSRMESLAKLDGMQAFWLLCLSQSWTWARSWTVSQGFLELLWGFKQIRNGPSRLQDAHLAQIPAAQITQEKGWLREWGFLEEKWCQ